MSLGHEHGFVLIGLAGPMDVVNLSLSLSLSPQQNNRDVLAATWLGIILLAEWPYHICSLKTQRETGPLQMG